MGQGVNVTLDVGVGDVVDVSFGVFVEVKVIGVSVGEDVFVGVAVALAVGDGECVGVMVIVGVAVASGRKVDSCSIPCKAIDPIWTTLIAR